MCKRPAEFVIYDLRTVYPEAGFTEGCALHVGLLLNHAPRFDVRPIEEFYDHYDNCVCCYIEDERDSEESRQDYFRRVMR